MKKLTLNQVRQLVDLQGTGDRDGLSAALRDLSRDALAELKALLWLARDDESPRHWEALVIEARFKVDEKTAGLFAEDPELGNSLTRGLEILEASGRL
ncbi:DUF3775 domain-containing protein [Natronospira bacteriovora]|uniref:DUF3775 domain-containing protein n=1 Tax=Natronospira bacteriovora TaxID=3069753 RepID=A0ABU0W8D4_9GAMM|nr:DUF3775 domain-containing protein [Natronospira sp. AB-CW4]MDQ2070261.1 DUF3775 domain-containing protein [Natronospira sp. AB-CW4]